MQVSIPVVPLMRVAQKVILNDPQKIITGQTWCWANTIQAVVTSTNGRIIGVVTEITEKQ